MHEKPHDRKREILLRKDSWHSFSLQHLSTAKFGAVVNHILSGEHLLVGPYRRKRGTVEK